MQWEGEQEPKTTAQDRQAVQVFNATANGSGGIDWQAVPLFAAFFGAHDVEGLIERLLVLKSHRPPGST